MLQFIAIALLGYIAYRFISSLKKPSVAREQRSPKRHDVPSINTVRCAHCGLHIAATDAVHNDASSNSYCCEEHARLG
ncbi:PP0621 family protein [Carnimonas bestiolae]|uniref:PP0621 family protein n=1 Tax=Carnimonas bestiolae TaxID=3402172 RepID=UPI003EDC5159